MRKGNRPTGFKAAAFGMPLWLFLSNRRSGGSSLGFRAGKLQARSTENYRICFCSVLLIRLSTLVQSTFRP